MSINSFFHGLASNFIFGGVAVVLLMLAMFWKANKVAESGNKAKMATWSLAPSMMVIAAVLMHSVAAAVVIPRLQAMFQSAPVQNTMAMGDALTTAADGLLFGNYSGESGVYIGTDAFKAPVQEASAPLVNNGQTASFVEQPVPITTSNEIKIMSNEQAVTAFKSFDATATPEPMAYINQFVADNSQTIEVKADTTGSYTVKSGDSLAKIAKAVYGDSSKWTLICNANRSVIADCNNIRAGVALVIPDASSAVPANNSQVVSNQPTAIPAWGQQSANYAKPAQPQQQAAATVRNINNGQVVITNNSDAVAAVQNLPPAPTATPRPAYVLTEVLNKPATGGGQAYIDQFLKTQTDTTVASAGN